MCDIRRTSGARLVLEASQVGLDLVKVTLQLYLMRERDIGRLKGRLGIVSRTEHHDSVASVLQKLNDIAGQGKTELHYISCTLARYNSSESGGNMECCDQLFSSWTVVSGLTIV